MLPLREHRVLLGITGGIASYKSAILARRLIDAGADVRVVMTNGAQAFITPLTFQALTGNPVHTDLLDSAAEAAMGHIELARWADLILIAPASANTLARLANGLADDLLTTLCLASDAPLFAAPAMNHLMWLNPATQANCQTLAERGMVMFGPADGAQACGESGVGRMLEPEAIRDALIKHIRPAPVPRLTRSFALADESARPDLSEHDQQGNDETGGSTVTALGAANQPHAVSSSASSLDGLRLLITAGPTREAIDPVRYLSNHSSGKMGFAIAAVAAERGATVTLVAGPVSLATPRGVERVDVTTAIDMHTAVMQSAATADVFIAVAAVADYRLDSVAEQKIKKHKDELTLTLTKNPDILRDVAALEVRPFCVGFAAETENVEQHARRKLTSKKLDLIAANHVAQADNPVFGSDTNVLDILWNTDGHEHVASAPKRVVAARLLDVISRRLKAAAGSSG